MDQTQVLKSIGPHTNSNNLTTIMYCSESPLETLYHFLENGIQIGGYRQLGQVRVFGDGIVIRNADSFNLFEQGLDIIGSLDGILVDELELSKGEVTERDLIWTFNQETIKPYLDIGPWKGAHSLFRIHPEQLTLEQQKVIESAREFVKAVKGKEVTTDYLISLSYESPK